MNITDSAISGGEAIRILRSERGLSQERLAVEGGTSTVTLSKLENGTPVKPVILDGLIKELHRHKPVSDGVRASISRALGHAPALTVPDEDEIARAKAACRPNLESTPFPAYLADFIHRVHDWNAAALALLGLAAADRRIARLTLYDLLFSPTLNDRYTVENRDQAVKHFCQVIKREFAEYPCDGAWRQSVADARVKYPEFARLWDTTETSDNESISLQKMGPIVVAFGGQGTISFNLTATPVLSDARFRAVGYSPADLSNNNSYTAIAMALGDLAASSTPSLVPTLPTSKPLQTSNNPPVVSGLRHQGADGRHRVPPKFPRGGGEIVGRDREVSELISLLRPNVPKSRWVSLTGLGGMGKTSLAISVANAQSEEYEYGVHYVDLAGDAAPSVEQAVCAAFGVSDADTVIAHLASRSLLLVVDECANQRDACARFLQKIYDYCDRVNIIATSSERLGARSEREYHVAPLGCPADMVGGWKRPEDLEASPAVSVFLHYMDNVIGSPIVLSTANAHVVADICDRTGGVPVLIKLAAYRVRLVGLDRTRALLSETPTTFAKDRHSGDTTERDWEKAVLRPIFNRLSSKAQLTLAELCIFPRYFTRDAAEAVCSDQDIDASLEDLYQLRLIDPDTPNVGRFYILQPIRDHCAKAILVDTAAARTRHLDHYLNVAAKAAPNLSGDEQVRWMSRLALDFDNFRFAMEYGLQDGALGTKALQMSTIMSEFGIRRGAHFAEGAAHLERMLSAANDAPVELKAEAQCYLGKYTWLLNLDHQQPTNHFRKCEDLATLTGRVDLIVQSKAFLAALAELRGDIREAEVLSADALSIASEHCNRQWVQALALHFGSFIPAIRRNFGLALSMCKESLAILEELKDHWYITHVLLAVGYLYEQQGNSAAVQWYRKSYDISDRLSDPRGAIWSLTAIAAWYIHAGQTKLGITLLGYAEVLRERTGTELGRSQLQAYNGAIPVARQRVTADEFNSLWVEGRHMSDGDIFLLLSQFPNA